MDLTRLGDKKYIAELAAESKRVNADPIYIGERTNYLDSLLPVIGKQLRETASWQMPQGININESVAICLALNIKEAFQNHTAQFLSVPPWLQAWVLKKWRMENFIGQRIGSIE
jgi:hypothetical protein